MKYTSILLLYLGAACNSDPLQVPISDVTGTWTLSTVNGETLPAALRSGPDTVIGAETLVLGSTGLAIRARVLKSPAADTGIIQTTRGNLSIYSLGAFVDFMPQSITSAAQKSPPFAQVVNGRLELDARPDTLVYVRQ